MTAIDVNGVELHYDDVSARESGDGSTIVWLHGFLFTAELFGSIIGQMPRHRHIAIDSRGHGRSADVVENATVSQMADDAWEILKALEVDRFVCVGHSMGNAVGMRLVTQHPEAAVAGVSLAGVPLAGMPESTREGNRSLPALVGDEAAFRDVLGTFFVHDGMDAVLKEGAAAAALVQLPVLESIGLTELYLDDSQELLAGMTQPWLFMIPTEDGAIPADSQFATAAQVPGARTVALDGEGHIHPQERPAETAAYIEAFLTSVAAVA